MSCRVLRDQLESGFPPLESLKALHSYGAVTSILQKYVVQTCLYQLQSATATPEVAILSD